MRGEISGSVKFMVSFVLALMIWFSAWTVRGWSDDGNTRLSSQQSRLRTLLMLGGEYKELSPSSAGNAPQNVDAAVVFAQVSEKMQLGSRVNRITPDGRNQSVEINRLYADELAELYRQLSANGVRVTAAEIRALPSGRERLFTVSAIIAPVNP